MNERLHHSKRSLMCGCGSPKVIAVPRDILLTEVAEADALWSVLADSINREVFEAGKKLKVVANMAVGYNNIDLEAAKEHEVIVTNTPGVLTETTADLAFALLLATARKLTCGGK